MGNSASSARESRPAAGTFALWVAGVVALLAVVTVLVVRVRQLLIVNHDSGGVEPNVVYGVQTLLSTGKLYFDPSTPPYSVMQYSPLYYYVVAALAWVLRVAPEDVLELFVLNRSCALTFTLALPAVLYALCRLFEVPKFVSGLVAAWGFAFIYVTDFGRPDSLYHSLSLASTYCFVRYAKLERTSTLYGALGLAVLALFTKQSGLVLLPMMLSYLVWVDRRWRRIGLALALYVALALGLFGLFALLNGGPFRVWENVHGGIDNGIDLDWFFRRIVEFYGRELAGWCAVIASACAWLWIAGARSAATTALIVSLSWQLAFGVLTSLKWGSMPSYFSPFLAQGFAALAIALFAPEYRPPGDTRWPALTFAACLVSALLVNVPVMAKWAWLKDESERFNHASAVAKYLQDEKQLQAGDGVLSLIAGELTLETSFLNNLLYRNALMPQKDVVTCCAFKRKRFDYSEFARQANAGMVKFIVKGRDNRVDQYAGAQFTRFKKTKTLFEFDIYEYAP